jgi:hypothetical protein
MRAVQNRIVLVVLAMAADYTFATASEAVAQTPIHQQSVGVRVDHVPIAVRQWSST